MWHRSPHSTEREKTFCRPFSFLVFLPIVFLLFAEGLFQNTKESERKGLLYLFNKGKKSSQCDLIPEVVQGADPFTINEVRRNLVLKSPACFSRHFRLFEKAFLARPRHRHMNLHVPKSGGTTICQSVKKAGKLSTTKQNCWEGDFCPLWCCCGIPRPSTCANLAKLPYDFIMNENWFDEFCPDSDRVYSIVIREPVSRAISHVNNLLPFIASHGKESFGIWNWRLNLGQSNYLT